MLSEVTFKVMPRAESALTLLATALPLAALASNATKEEAVTMVKKGVAFIKTNGVDKGYSEITAKNPSFVDRDLYLVVYGLDGKCLAHGANPKQIGRDLTDLTDLRCPPRTNPNGSAASTCATPADACTRPPAAGRATPT